MKELNKNEIYSLEGLNDEQLRELSEKCDFSYFEDFKEADYIRYKGIRWCYGSFRANVFGIKDSDVTAKAIDLFNNEIKREIMQEIKKGQVWEHIKTGERVEVEKLEDGYVYLNIGRTTNYHSFTMFWELVEENKEQSISPHYNNDKGSLYQFCEDKGLNSYEFDLIKRIMRCRKKGQFIEDLEKTKFLIDLYIKEYHEKSK